MLTGEAAGRCPPVSEGLLTAFLEPLLRPLRDCEAFQARRSVECCGCRQFVARAQSPWPEASITGWCEWRRAPIWADHRTMRKARECHLFQPEGSDECLPMPLSSDLRAMLWELYYYGRLTPGRWPSASGCPMILPSITPR